MTMVFNKQQKPYLDKDGYRYVPWHPDIDPKYKSIFTRNYAPEHRLQLALHLGRPLKSHEHVHHLDKNRTNNDPSNLELHDVKNHIKLHISEGGLKLFTSDYQPKRMRKKASYLAPAIVGGAIGAGYKAIKAQRDKHNEFVDPMTVDTPGKAAIKGGIQGALVGLGFGGVRDYLKRNKKYKSSQIRLHDKLIKKQKLVKSKKGFFDVIKKYKDNKNIKALEHSKAAIENKKYFSPIKVFRKKASDRELDLYTKMFLTSGQPNKTITSDKIIKDIKKRHGLDTEVAVMDTPRDDVYSGFLPKSYISTTKPNIRKPNFFTKIFKQEHVLKESNKYEKDFHNAMKRAKKKKHGLIVLDKDVYKKHPEVVAHELGHAITYNNSLLGKPIESLRIGRLGKLIKNTAPIVSAGANVFPKIPNFKASVTADAIGLIPGTAVLADEFLASLRALKEIKKSGGVPNKMTLLKPFSTYLLSNLPNFLALGLTLNRLKNQKLTTTKYPAITKATLKLASAKIPTEAELKEAKKIVKDIKNLPGETLDEKYKNLSDGLVGTYPNNPDNSFFGKTNKTIGKVNTLLNTMLPTAIAARYSAGLVGPRKNTINTQNKAVKYSPLGLLGVGAGVYAGSKLSPKIEKYISDTFADLSKNFKDDTEKRLIKNTGVFINKVFTKPKIMGLAGVLGGMAGASLIGAGFGLKERLRKKNEDRHIN